MVGLVVGQVDLEQVETVVDAADEAEFAGEKVEGADATVHDAAAAIRDLVVNVGGSEDGLGRTAAVVGVETAFDAPLAVVELLVYRRVHSKTLVVGVDGETVYSSDTPGNTRVFEFFSDSRLLALEGLAYSRARSAECAALRLRVRWPMK